MTLKLFDHPLSPYGQKVKIALNEKGVEYAAIMPDAIGSGSTKGEFASGSPRGEVPLLLHDGYAVFDSTVILEYIEDSWPEPALLPAAPADRARVRMLEDAMDTHFEAINWGLSEVRHFKRLEGAAAERVFELAGEQLTGWFAWLDGQLGDAHWFNGAEFGWGDLSVLPYVNGAAGFGFSPRSPRLQEWAARANLRPSVQPVVAAAQAVAFDSEAVSLEAVHQALEAGLFKREYRDHRLEWMVRTAGLSVVAEGIAKDNVRFIEPFPPPSGVA